MTTAVLADDEPIMLKFETVRALIVEWYRKAAEQGVPNAQVSLARMYEAGRGGLKKDMNRAEVLRRKAAYRRDCKSSCNDFCEFARPGAPLLSALLCMASPETPSKR